MEIALSNVLGEDDIITPARPDLQAMRGQGVQAQNYRLDHPLVPKRPFWRKLFGRPERYHHPSVGYYEHMPGWRVRAYLGEEIWSSYYKFAFERNPWDRQVSYYFYKTRSKEKKPSFASFLRQRKKAWVENWEIYTINDQICVDHVGLYEQVDQDFANVMDRLGLGDRVQLPKANVGQKTDHQSYRDFYTDETRALVAQWYRQEIDAFGYEF